jgi:hypothetical protein
MTKKTKSPIIAQRGEIILFQTYDGHTKIQVRFEDNRVWLTQKMMAELYQISVKTVNEHLKNIFNDRELFENSVVRQNRITAADGVQLLQSRKSSTPPFKTNCIGRSTAKPPLRS